ncbi:MAG TPA: VOC family protein [Chthoniobacterales bacterium]|jgi:catechol 2,3-dioxygenase-like lactoylglutathione lyase family enzyme|nr:VOC family protein [Chthoniobacterales bacterium]
MQKRQPSFHLPSLTLIALAAIAALRLTTFAQTPTPASQPPRVDHILLEVKDMKASVAFYRDLLGLRVKSEKPDFTLLESGNVGVFLSTGHWEWDEARPKNARPGWGMYPHFDVADVAEVIERARKAGYRIAQEPRKYNWGTEGFVADPDGYVWALVSPPK